ncbi:MAG: ATP-dependent zinc metalloprotease FtsH [Planctomycetota bacterium]|nr:ATP-dependent zinc metalloprotease FtsH [Planctomycetota bacterium]
MSDPNNQGNMQGPGQSPDGAQRPRRNFPLLLLFLGLITAVILVFSKPAKDVEITTVDELNEWIMDKDEPWVNELTIVDMKTVRGTFRDIDATRHFEHTKFEIPYTGTGLTNTLTGEQINAWSKMLRDFNGTVSNKESGNSFLTGLLSFLPWLLLLVLFWWLLMRQMRNVGGSGVMQFGRSKARVHMKEQSHVTFKDVAGIEEAKEEVREIVTFLKAPQKFRRIGARIPRGVLLVGNPGCGKTLLAKAIAGEADVPFFSVSGSDFVEMFVGVGASRVRDLFKQARENAPCIVFLDEIDAVGRRRGTGLGGGHDEREQTLNQILVEMDGFDTDAGIILLAATNRPDVLDPALLRPGRFDRQIVINLPDVKGREAILRVHGRKVKMDPSVDLSRVARATPGFSGAELEALVNEAALLAVTQGRENVILLDMEEARDKIRFGRSRKSMVMTEHQKKITAYHEAGHAILTLLEEKADPLHKVTIIPRGMALGATMSLPERDRLGMSRGEIEAQLRVLFGGRIAEDLIFKDITSGAQNDIEQATRLARLMVTKWGMSDAVGPISYAEGEEHLFLGREVTRQVNHSEETAQAIDQEVRRFIDEAYKDAEQKLTHHIESLHRVAEALIRWETLSGEETEAVLEGADIATLRPPPAPTPDETPTRPAATPAQDDPMPEGGKPAEGFAY